MKLILLPVAIFATASCSNNSSTPTDPTVIKRGMTKEEITTNLGTPAYQYGIDSRETWVYLQGNPNSARAKSTAVNMVPIVGPLVSLATTAKPSTKIAKSAVTFDKDGKVTRIEEAE